MRPALIALLASFGASLAGCSLVRDADDVVVGDGLAGEDAAAESGAETSVAEAGVDATVGDSSLDSTLDTSIAPADTSAEASLLDAPADVAPPLDRTWAQWRMPSVTPTAYTATATVVTDSTTGLRWQRVVANAATYDDAVAACAALVLDGKQDYRLPTRIELISLLAIAKGVKPTILSGATTFAGTPAESFWTASSIPSGGRYVVDFSNANVKTALGTESLRYRCVGR